MKVYKGLIKCDLYYYIQLSEQLLRVFRYALVLDLSIIGVNFKFAIAHLMFSVFYGYT